MTENPLSDTCKSWLVDIYILVMDVHVPQPLLRGGTGLNMAGSDILKPMALWKGASGRYQCLSPKFADGSIP